MRSCARYAQLCSQTISMPHGKSSWLRSVGSRLMRIGEKPHMVEERRYELARGRGPEDDDPSRRSPKLVRGIRRYSVLHNLHKSDDTQITLDHMKAVARLVADYEIGILGASPPGAQMEKVDGSRSYGVAEVRLKAATAFRQARAALGPRNFCLLEMVAFDNQSVSAVAEAYGINNHHAKGRLIACLDSLHDHYNPPPLAVAVSSGYEFVDEDVRSGRFER